MKRLLVLLIFSACAMAQVATVPGRKIMLFGGVNHTTYLGCLSCNEFASDSVLNTSGRYGSEFQTGSIFNSFGPYGSKFQSTSACYDFATNPPVTVDNRGAACFFAFDLLWNGTDHRRDALTERKQELRRLLARMPPSRRKRTAGGRRDPAALDESSRTLAPPARAKAGSATPERTSRIS